MLHAAFRKMILSHIFDLSPSTRHFVHSITKALLSYLHAGFVRLHLGKSSEDEVVFSSEGCIELLGLIIRPFPETINYTLIL